MDTEAVKKKIIPFDKIKESRSIQLISQYYQSLSLGHLLKEAQTLCESVENGLNENIVVKCKEILKELENRYHNNPTQTENPIGTIRKYLDRKIK